MTLEQQLKESLWDELTKICFENNVNPKDVNVEFLPGIINITLPAAIRNIEIKGYIDFDDKN